MSFRLARMDRLLFGMTALLLPLPVVLWWLSPGRLLWPAALFVLLIYLVILLWLRPLRFELGAEDLLVVWPLRRERIPLRSIQEARRLDTNHALKSELGFAMRIGAGGLWGGFGLLKTEKRGMMRFYISRISDYVFLSMSSGKSWLITPEGHRRFLRELERRGIKVQAEARR